MVCVTESFLLNNALTNYQSSEAVYCNVLLPFKETAISQKILSMVTCLQLECQGKSVDLTLGSNKTNWWLGWNPVRLWIVQPTIPAYEFT